MKKSINTESNALEKELSSLSAAEKNAMRKELKKDENIIHESRNSWKAAPTALTRIRDRRLYRAEGFRDFGSYCKERIKLGKSTVNRYIAIGEVYTILASTGAKTFPISERQMRPLIALRNSDESPTAWGPKVAQVWEKAVNDAEVMKKRLTEQSVIRAKEQLGFAPDPKDVQQTFDVEKAWTRLEDLLWHEREFWPQEHWPDMELRIYGLLSGWEGRVLRVSGDSETPTESSKSVVELETPASEQSSPVPSSTEAISATRFNKWSDVNWRLSNADIAETWGLNPNTVKQMRYRKKRGPRLDGDSAEYERLLQAEKEKGRR